jgi:hypothetical protein
LLTVDPETGRSRLAWLQQSATTYSPQAILATLAKRDCCIQGGVDRWDVSSLNPNRLKFLAQIARRSTNQAMQRMPEKHRYPILVAFLHQTLIDLNDEAIDLFDQCLAEAYHRAGRELKDFRLAVARSTNEKVRLFREIGRVVLDAKVRDANLRRAIYQRIPPAELQTAVEESDRIIQPLDDHHIDFLESRYAYLRQFSPQFFEALAFRSHSDSSLLPAVEVIRQLNREQRRTLPDEAPRELVPAPWQPYAIKNTNPLERRHYYELCDERLPLVGLSELLIEVDRWTRFSEDFEHAGGTAPQSPELRNHLYAALLAQASNLGLTRMARISDLTYRQLAWCTNWYLRDETLKAANTRLVNFHYHQPLSRHWGGTTRHGAK